MGQYGKQAISAGWLHNKGRRKEADSVYSSSPLLPEKWHTRTLGHRVVVAFSLGARGGRHRRRWLAAPSLSAVALSPSSSWPLSRPGRYSGRTPRPGARWTKRPFGCACPWPDPGSSRRRTLVLARPWPPFFGDRSWRRARSCPRWKGRASVSGEGVCWPLRSQVVLQRVLGFSELE